MHLQRALLDLAFRIQIIVKAAAGQPPAHHFHGGDFDNTMAELGFQAGGFSVDKNLAHVS
jgi:hypothetical protein